MSPNGYIRRRRADVIEDTARDVRSSPTRRPVVFAIILLRPETLRRLRPSWRSRRRRVRRFVHFPTMCDSTPSDDARPPSRPSNATPRSLFFAQCRQPPAFTRLQTAFIPLPDLRFDISHPQLSHRPSAAQKPHPKPVSFPFRPFFRTRVRPPHSNFASTRQRPRLLHRTYLLQCRLNSTTNQLTRPVVFLASFSQMSMLTPDFLPGPHRNACTHAPAAVHPVDRSIAPRTHRRTPRYTQTFTFVLDAPHFATNPIYRLYHPRISSLFFAITSPHPKPTTTHSLHAASLHARRTHARPPTTALHRIPSVKKRPKLSTPSSPSTSKNVKPFDSAIFPFVSIAKLSRAAVTATQLEAIAFCVKVGSKWTNHTPPFSTNRSSPHVDQPRPTGSAGAVYNRALAGRDI